MSNTIIQQEYKQCKYCATKLHKTDYPRHFRKTETCRKTGCIKKRKKDYYKRRKKVPCSNCKEERAVYTRDKNKNPICRKCYKQPEKICSICGKFGIIEFVDGKKGIAYCRSCAKRRRYEKRKQEFGIKDKKLVIESLIKNHMNYILGREGKQKTFEWLKSQRKGYLRIDIAYESIKLAVECDGEQHKNPDHYFNKIPTMDFQYRQKCDEIKERKLKENGWKVLRFSYDFKGLSSHSDYKGFYEKFSIPYLTSQLEMAGLGQYIINRQEVLC